MKKPSAISRRHFLSAAALGAAAAPQFISAAEQKPAPSPTGRAFEDPAKSLPLVNDADVIVCGAGPAGIAAAMTAARAGARTRLFEVHGCLGGVWTAGLLTCIFDFEKPGLTRELKRAGVTASYGHPTLFPVRDDLVMLMLNHEYGIKAFDAAGITAATMRSRAEVFRIMRALRALGGVWEGLQIAATAEQIGARDGRRIKGRYTMTRKDLMAGARQTDAVARVTFGVDIHADSAETNKVRPIDNGDFKMKPYDIPLRALIAKDVDGLMMAGRCISGDFTAHASYRVTGNAVAMGEAAGVVGAIAAMSKRQPHEVEWTEGAARLKQMGQRG